MKYLLEFTIVGLPKRTNNNHASWRGRAAEARKWKRAVIAHVDARNKPKTPLKKAKLTLTRYSSSEPDFDGLVSGFKHCVDGLIEAGVIENDKMSNVGIPTYQWERVARNSGHVRIKVEEL